MTHAMSVTRAQSPTQTIHPIVVLVYLIGEFLNALPMMYRFTTVVLILPEMKMTVLLAGILFCVNLSHLEVQFQKLLERQ